MKCLLVLALAAFAASPIATAQLPAPAKPPLTVAMDGFPAGTDTPEGAACDFARAFIRDDPTLLLSVCIEPYGDPESRLAAHKFLERIVVQMSDATRATPPPDSPKSIAKCYAARHLGKSAAALSGYAATGFQDVVFVDVVSEVHSGEAQLCRTLVIKTKQGKWAVEPEPELAPSLSDGLDDESASTRDFSEAYTITLAPSAAPAASLAK